MDTRIIRLCANTQLRPCQAAPAPSMACFVRRRLLSLIARQLARLVGTQTTFPFSLSHDKMVDMAGTLSDTAWYEEEDEEDG